MKRNVIPNTNLEVSPFCLGTMTFGTPVEETEAIHITHHALDLGVNFIDTANMYEGYKRYIGSPGGVAEDIVGKALKGKQEKVILATKVGMKIGPGDDDQGLSRAHILREVDRSLSRLQCETIDLYYMHKPDINTPIEESAQTFNDIIKAGKIRHWGISNFNAEQIANLLKLCDNNGWQRPVALQPAYSLLKTDIEAETLPLCQQENIAIFPYQVLQGGMLTGKYRRGEAAPVGSRQTEKPEWTLPLNDDTFDRLEKIEAEADDKGRTLLQHALKALLEKPMVLSLILGVKSISQMDRLLEAIQ
jgi:aryl-alcohol dehydrogenase-like predicted oxidoreductase